MNKQVVRFAISGILTLWPLTVSAQMSMDYIKREVSAEVALFNDLGHQYDQVIDADVSNEQGMYQKSVVAAHTGASSSGSQHTTTVFTPNSLQISGSLNASCAQAEPGTRRFFRSWSLMITDVTITSPGTYSLAGEFQGPGYAQLMVINRDTGENRIVLMEAGVVALDGVLTVPGTYRFDLSVWQITSSEAVENKTLGLDFVLAAAVNDVAANETLRWGDLKAQFRE